MKRSLAKQITCIFVGVLIFAFLSAFLVNVCFLERYYIHGKQDTLTSAYEDINEALYNNEITSSEFLLKLEKICDASNIAVYAIDPTGSVYLNNAADEGILKDRLLEHIFAQQIARSSDSESREEELEGNVLQETDSYILLRTEDDRTKTEYLEMWGHFEDGSAFLMRTPLESIRESVRTANRFLLFAALGAILIGSILIFFFTRRITKPITELTELSGRMAELDFGAQYESGGENEIGVLGENFNRMSKSLEHSITDLKRANLELRKDIEQKEAIEAMRTDFLSNVSHELKTPIAVIQGYAEGLADGIADDAESRKYYSEVIVDEANKMNTMVRRLLELNQLEFGRDELQVECFDLCELIRGVLQANKVLADESGILIQTDIPESLQAFGDEFLIEEVFTNYLTNAIHHADGEKRIEVSLEILPEAARVHIFNTGDPIPEKDLPHIWEKFYKVDKARTRAYGGNGIGLSIVKAVMDAHSQKYGAENVPGGVDFWFDADTSKMHREEVN